MPFYITRTKALYKLSIPEKIFDWLCFLNGISVYYPRKKENKNGIVYFLLKDIKKIKKSKILIKLKQIVDWKHTIRYFKNRQKFEKIFYSINHIPSYKLDSYVKKNFIFFKKALSTVKQLFSFILLVLFKFEKHSSNIKDFSKFFYIKQKFFYIFSSLNRIQKIFITRDTIHLEYDIFGEKSQIYFPKKFFFFKKKKLCEFLLQYYICLFSFILKKIGIFFNSRFINFLNAEKFDIYKSAFEPVKRNYKSNKRFTFSIEIFSNKYDQISNFFLNSKKNYKIIKKIPWTFSKNINLPSQFSILKNPILQFENSNINEYIVLILKCLKCKVLFTEHHKKITHVIYVNKTQEYSLICLKLNISLISDMLNNHNILPIFLSKLKCLKKNISNPFSLNIKKKTIFIRNKYGKKKILITEISDINKKIWISKNIIHNLGQIYIKKKNIYKKK